MTVNEFIENGMNVDKLKIIEYVDFLEKSSRAENLVRNTSLDNNGNVHLNSTGRYMFYVLTIIDLWTDIDIDFTIAYKEFDELNKNGLINSIVLKIKESEIKEFDLIVRNHLDDLMYNQGSMNAVIRNQADRIIDLTSALLSPFMERLTVAVENMDDEQVSKIENVAIKLLNIIDFRKNK